jgi:hypothetical protein
VRFLMADLPLFDVLRSKIIGHGGGHSRAPGHSRQGGKQARASAIPIRA